MELYKIIFNRKYILNKILSGIILFDITPSYYYYYYNIFLME